MYDESRVCELLDGVREEWDFIAQGVRVGLSVRECSLF